MLMEVKVPGQGACNSGSLPPHPLTFQHKLFRDEAGLLPGFGCYNQHEI